METYWQRDLVINNREVRYDGIFNFDEVMRTLKSALREKGYECKEKRTEETVMEEGRKSFLEARPFKVKTDYITLMMKIKINLINTGEIVQELPGRKRRMQQGEISLVFDAWFLSDYEHRWENRPMLQFVRWLFDRFFYLSYTERFEQRLTSEVHKIYAFMEQYFNMTRTHYKPTNLPRF